MNVLSASDTPIRHRAAFWARFDNHFTGLPVREELDVCLVNPVIRPLRNSAGGFRHADGTYRFVNLPAGAYHLRVASPSGHWLIREPNLPVSVPPNDATLPTVQQLWPSPSAANSPGVTTVRGRLRGPNVGGLRLAIKPSALAGQAPYHTFSDDQGEFLFPYPARTVPDPISGRVELQIGVESGTRAVAGGRVLGVGGGDFVLDHFHVLPGRETRVLFEVAP